MFRIIALLIFSTLLGSCSWISRDYYYSNEPSSEGWVAQHIPGKDSDKNGPHPAYELLTFRSEEIKIELYLNYQDLLLFGPIIPIIPAPLSSNENLSVVVSMQSESAFKFNPLDLTVKDLATGNGYSPMSVHPYNTSENNAQNFEYYVQFPVGVRKLSNIEVNVGEIEFNDKSVFPSVILLRKVKGKTHLNQFTL